MRYLIFQQPIKSYNKNSSQFFRKIIKKILAILLPVSNPDFEEKLDKVRYWLLEFENNNDYPIREIGLDEDNCPIVKMPYKENYGYWTDNELKYNDFIDLFSAKKIDNYLFEDKWERL